MRAERQPRTRLFAPIPRQGPWTALGLTRGQFFAILLGSCLVFLFWNGPLWANLGGRELGRLMASYIVIPVAVAAALAWNGRLRGALWLGASSVITVLKLVITAGLDLLLGMALRGH